MDHDVSHEALMEKLIEHENAITSMGSDIKAINVKLDPIVLSLGSIARAFRALVWLGAASAAVVAIIELGERIG